VRLRNISRYELNEGDPLIHVDKIGPYQHKNPESSVISLSIIKLRSYNCLSFIMEIHTAEDQGIYIDSGPGGPVCPGAGSSILAGSHCSSSTEEALSCRAAIQCSGSRAVPAGDTRSYTVGLTLRPEFSLAWTRISSHGILPCPFYCQLCVLGSVRFVYSSYFWY